MKRAFIIILIFVFAFSFYARAPSTSAEDSIVSETTPEFVEQVNGIIREVGAIIKLPLKDGVKIDCEIIDHAEAKTILGPLYNPGFVGFYRDHKIYLIKKIGITVIKDRSTIAHEGVHALQDLWFNFSLLNHIKRVSSSDKKRAIYALQEGHATHAEIFTSGDPFSLEMAKCPIVFFYSDGSLGDLGRIFVYEYGWRFVKYLHEKGGWNLVNSAFKKLPESSEQIMHPEKYLAGEKFDAVNVPIPDGYTIDNEGTYGEFGILSIMLKDGVSRGVMSEETALSVASGWNGDKFVVMSDERGSVLKFVTHWDNEEDAKEFFNAYIALTNNDWGVNPDPEFNRKNSKTWISCDAVKMRVMEMNGRKITIRQY